MSSFLETQLRQYGVETQIVDLGTHLMDGQNLKLPPLVLGKIGNDISKKTILIYGHFDVQPVRFFFVFIPSFIFFYSYFCLLGANL
jgi:Cys-Gly metallodipeptidase DUG1